MGAAPILTILKDGELIKSQPLEGEAMLGRSEGCVIRIDDRAISRQHAVFRPVADGVRIEKKSEFAPISVNGAECTSALIKEGDVIAIGPYLLKLSMEAQAIPEVPPEVPPESPPELPEPLQLAPVTLVTTTVEVLPEASQEAEAEVRTELKLEAPPEVAPEAPAETAEVLEAAPQEAAEVPADAQIEIADSSPEPSSTPEFSLDIKPLEDSGPIDLGEIQVDEDGSTKLAPAAKISAKLILPEGIANVTELELKKDEVSIGRGNDCDLILEDKKASRRHAIIRRNRMSFSIKDLESANGTYVNGLKIQEHELSGDDTIKIGNAEFRFLVVSAEYERIQQNFMPVPNESEIGLSDFPAQENQRIPDPPRASGTSGQGAMPLGGASMGGIAGLAGIGGITAKKQTLFQKYRALPPRRKAIWTVVIIAALYFAFFDEETPQVHPKRPVAVAGVKAVATFDSLTPAQKKFVESQHALAFDYYRNREYDKSIFEIDKIFALIPDYKDSREIERYAKEGKRKLEALQEEKRKQEEEAKLKLKVAELVDDAKALMDQKKYDQTEDLFSQILALDPDNQYVADWRKQVDAYEEQKRIENEQKEVQAQINARAWDLYKEGVALKERKKYGEAIDSFRRVAQIGATDKRVERSAAARIRDIEQLIADIRDPILGDAKQAEDSQDYAKAYKLYQKATEIDPSYPAGYAGMDRVRGVLHEQAKSLYIEAVLAESYTDFDTAKKKYQECLRVAPKDDIYHDRAERKLASFFNPEDGAPGSSDTDGGAP